MALRVPCPMCGKVPPPPCDCPPLPPGPPDDEESADDGKSIEPSRPIRHEPVRLRREKRRGRAVIVIEGLPPSIDIAACARELKRICASGGTVKGSAIEIQGEHRDRIERHLHELGLSTKRSGG